MLSDTPHTSADRSPSPSPSAVRRTYKYRIYPTQQQKGKLDHTMHLCRQLYNSALQERREAYQMTMGRVSLNYYDQANQLKECKLDECRPDLRDVHSLVPQDVLKRVDRAFDGFFRRVKDAKAGGTAKPGYPRYQGRGRYNSFTYLQYGNGWTLEHQADSLTGQGRKFGVLHLSKIGDIKLRLHRPLLGTPKTVTIIREGRTYQGEWYACISCDGVPLKPLEPTGAEVGIDMGLLHFATLSTGEKVHNPRWYRKAQALLAQKQQAVSHSNKGSRRQSRRRAEVARLHRRIRRQRLDFQHKLAHQLIEDYDLIVLEKLQIGNMSKRAKPVVDEAATQERADTDGKRVYAPNGAAAKCGLNKSILDAGWGQFGRIMASKAECAGRRVLFVAPQYTSQVCSVCGVIVPKELKERFHECDCGLLMDRDENAARNILAIGLTGLAGIPRDTLDTLGIPGVACVDRLDMNMDKNKARAGSARRGGELQVSSMPGAA